MFPAQFDYVRPKNLGETVEALARWGESELQRLGITFQRVERSHSVPLDIHVRADYE